MATIIIADDTLAYDGTFLETRPIGGTENAVINFARAMARRGHQVTAYTNCQRDIEHEGVRWVPLRDSPPQTCDLYIACQHPRLFGFVPKPPFRTICRMSLCGLTRVFVSSITVTLIASLPSTRRRSASAASP